MRSFVFGIFLLIAVACSGKTTEDAADQLRFRINLSDTLFVDPGDEILYLQDGLVGYQLADNDRYLYNFDRRENAVEIINLDQLKLERKIRFEKEGPDGTGGYVQSMYYAGGGNFVMAENHQLGIFDINATKLATHKIQEQTFRGDTLLENESLEISGILDEHSTNFITFYSEGFGRPLGIAKLRLEDYNLTKIPVSALADLENFRVELSDAQSMSVVHPSTYKTYVSEKLLLSSNAVNEVFLYNPKDEDLQHFTFNSRLTPNAQKRNIKNKVNSSEEFHEVLAEKGKDVSFLHFTYDKVHARYYRLSQIYIGEGPEGNRYKSILTVFDQDFNQLFETDDLPIDKVYRRYFAKDGKLYLYENIMDEMAFIVLEIEEENL
jgi:hypothetical protein